MKRFLAWTRCLCEEMVALTRPKQYPLRGLDSAFGQMTGSHRDTCATLCMPGRGKHIRTMHHENWDQYSDYCQKTSRVQA